MKSVQKSKYTSILLKSCSKEKVEVRGQKALQGIRTQIVISNSPLRERRMDICYVSNTFSYTPDMGILWYIIIFWLKLGVFLQISFFQNNFFISKIFFEIFWKKIFRFKFLFGLIYGEKKFFEKISKKILTQKN